MRVEWDLGPVFAFPEGQETEDDDFDNFFAGYLTRLDPQYNTRLEELLEQFQAATSSREMKNTAAEVSLAVATLEIETQANMYAAFTH